MCSGSVKVILVKIAPIRIFNSHSLEHLELTENYCAVSEAVRSGPVPRSELDVCLRPVGSPLPSLAIVSGWTETYEKMLSDTRFWIRAGNGSIRKVFLLRWSKTPLHEVGCDLEVYEWDKSTRRERFSQHEVGNVFNG